MELEKPITENPNNTESSNNQQSLKFSQHHAFIVGIDHYEKVSQLSTAVNDAKKIAEVLQEKHSFQVHPPLLDAKHSSLHTLLYQTMPDMVKSDDRVVFYFAGHGIAIDGDDGPAGYLAPADADPADLKTFIAMKDLRKILNTLPCRHLLIVMDCCFSGAFKWTSSTRHIGTFIPKKIYKERFDRFVHDPAWQVITSAGYDQLAMDFIQDKPIGERGLVATESGEAHSPFALALFQALDGEADTRVREEGDGLITATELYSYIRDKVEPATIEIGQKSRQTPGFFPLSKHDKGEFIFLHPKHRLNLPPRPSRSPYKGLNPYEEADSNLFYGRSHVIKELKTRLNTNRLLVVTGASGTGKSSVVKASLIPWLREKGLQIIVMNPGNHPLAALEQSLTGIDETNSQSSLLFIDQFEEAITSCQDKAERENFLSKLNQIIDNSSNIHQVVITVRSDFETQLKNIIRGDHWQKGLYTIPAFSLEDLKEAAFIPTVQEVMIFDPPELLDTIVGDVMQAPGAIPLMSYILDELYLAYNASGRQDRALNQKDYEKLGGLAGLLRRKADALFLSLDPNHQAMMKKVFLRMVSVLGELESRRVKIEDLNYSPAENLLVEEVIKKLIESRLIVKDTDYIEPAHPVLITSWKNLSNWIQKAGRDTLILIDRLGPQADQFAKSGNRQLLWNKNPNLAIAARLLQQPDHGLNAKEIKFVLKSIARNQSRLRIIWAITIATLIALSGLSILAWIEKGRAENQREIAQNQRDTAQGNFIISEAKSMLEKDPTLALRMTETALKYYKGDKIYNAGDKIYKENYFYKTILSSDTTNPLRHFKKFIFSRNGEFVLAGLHNNDMILWKINGYKLDSVQYFKGNKGRLRRADFSADGKWLLTGSQDSKARIWSIATGAPGKAFNGSSGPVTNVEFQPNGNFIATRSESPDGGVEDATAKIWDTISGKELFNIPIPQPVGIMFSPNGKLILTHHQDGRSYLWNITKNPAGVKLQNQFTSNWDDGAAITGSFSTDGKKVAIGHYGRVVRLYNLKGQHISTQVQNKGISKICFPPTDLNEQYSQFYEIDLSGSFITGTYDGIISLWNYMGDDFKNIKTELGWSLKILIDEKYWVTDIVQLKNGDILAAYSDGNVRLWDMNKDPESIPWQAYLKSNKIDTLPPEIKKTIKL